MGLLAINSGQTDVEAVLDVADQVATLWNDYGGTEHGFSLLVGQDAVMRVCEKGDFFLKKYFSKTCLPGPFKRTATLVVLGRLYPFFEMRPSRTTFLSTGKWLPRIVALMIPGALRSLRFNAADNPAIPKWKPLDKWRGFPSAHYKLDFMSWVESMDSMEWIDTAIPPLAAFEAWQETSEMRVARMILVTSLMIEACYYFGETNPGAAGPDDVRNKCKSFLLDNMDLTPLTYDIFLLNRYEEVMGKKP
jgi:hypothetical protein